MRREHRRQHGAALPSLRSAHALGWPRASARDPREPLLEYCHREADPLARLAASVALSCSWFPGFV